MKTFMAVIVLVGLSFSVSSQASVNASESAKPYSFKFTKFQGEVYEYETKSSSKNEAFERAAQACFDHYKAGRHISMDFGQDIIDVCVNPRSNI